MNMKRLIVCGLMGLLLVCVLGVCQAQTLRDGSNRTVGKIESDGTVRNGLNAWIGCFEKSGTIRGAGNRMVGSIDHGTIRDGCNMQIGSVESNGTVRNASYRKIIEDRKSSSRERV